MIEHAQQPIAARGRMLWAGELARPPMGKQKASSMVRCSPQAWLRFHHKHQHTLASRMDHAPAVRVARSRQIDRSGRPRVERIEAPAAAPQRHLVEFRLLSAVVSRANPMAPRARAEDQVGVTGGRGQGRPVRCRALISSHLIQMDDGGWGGLGLVARAGRWVGAR